MKKSVVSKQYQELQKKIVKLQEQWKQSLDPEIIQPNSDQNGLVQGVPAAALATIDFDISLYLQWIDETIGLLAKTNPELETKLGQVKTVLNDETAVRWIDEAFSFNEVYFKQFAEEKGLDAWIPPFLAETALRPYLQVAAEVFQPQITKVVPGTGCPVCGEPSRLAELEGSEGKKVMHCPRCLAHWPGKRTTCSHCGNEDHETLSYLTIEGDATSQIQVCEKCKGYTKVVDTRQFISKPSSAMLDFNTIHLDYVAQENGYNTATDGNESN